jgi:hypothetical protein
MKRTRYNPERKTWKGISYRKGGARITTLRIKARDNHDA